MLIEPHARVTSGTINYGDKVYNVGDYVPIAYLNTLGNKNASEWSKLDASGITIHNAVFAGGNTSSGSDKVFANATSIFGNATASIHDVYNRDLITLGTNHVGGLYGDGNLTFVDGYRGLNITNYGTDYYSISKEITIDDYNALPAREAAYYELRYTCVKECTDDDVLTMTERHIIPKTQVIPILRHLHCRHWKSYPCLRITLKVFLTMKDSHHLHIGKRMVCCQSMPAVR